MYFVEEKNNLVDIFIRIFNAQIQIGTWPDSNKEIEQNIFIFE